MSGVSLQPITPRASTTIPGMARLASDSVARAATSTTDVLTPASAKLHPGAASAWVNFNGVGTVAIRASFNVSSITDNGTGNYTVNFAAALNNANYVVNFSGKPNTGSASGTLGGGMVQGGVQTTAACAIACGNPSAYEDCLVGSFSAFGGQA